MLVIKKPLSRYKKISKASHVDERKRPKKETKEKT